MFPDGALPDNEARRQAAEDIEACMGGNGHEKWVPFSEPSKHLIQLSRSEVAMSQTRRPDILSAKALKRRHHSQEWPLRKWRLTFADPACVARPVIYSTKLIRFLPCRVPNLSDKCVVGAGGGRLGGCLCRALLPPAARWCVGDLPIRLPHYSLTPALLGCPRVDHLPFPLTAGVPPPESFPQMCTLFITRCGFCFISILLGNL